MQWHPDPQRLARPVYLSLAEQFTQAIQTGRLGAGTRLPPQRTLADRLGVSLQTVSRAYDELARRGMIAGEVGRGFAVVANEVRNLAQQSAKASQNIADLIGKSETDVRAGVMDASPFKQRLYELGMKTGLAALAEGKRSVFADQILFRALRDRLGFTRLRSAATGGAALGPDTFKFFQAMGVPLRTQIGRAHV